MERSRRFILFLAAAVFAAPLLFKGRAPSEKDGRMAFLPYTASGVTVRVRGMVRVPGVYSIPDGATVADVINLTAIRPGTGMPAKTVLDRQLRNGDIVEVTAGDPQSLGISLTAMKAGERMVLGIPLHPDRMDLEDWDSLPGIGPILARRILGDRQYNGDFHSLEGVRRVPGMGEKKFDMISKYF